MNFAYWGPLGSALGGLLGRLGAIWSVLERSCGISEPSCSILGAFWGVWRLSGGPRGRHPGGRTSLTGTSRDPPGSLPGPCRGTFRGETPRGRPARAKKNIVKQSPEILARLWPVGPANWFTRISG
eukprot:4582309-Pyramimonas_sp.AAC.1